MPVVIHKGPPTSGLFSKPTVVIGAKRPQPPRQLDLPQDAKVSTARPTPSASIPPAAQSAGVKREISDPVLERLLGMRPPAVFGDDDK